MKQSATGLCYHCESPIPEGVDIVAQIDGKAAHMCCHGCKAVAEAIITGGLSDFYRHRTAGAATPTELPPEKERELALFNREDIQKDYVRVLSDQEHECTLIIGDITCAACIWLLERFANEIPGVNSLDINHSTHRGVVNWDPSKIGLGEILTRLHHIGYRSLPYHPNTEQQMQERQDRQMLIRIIVAAFGMMQSMMFALPLYFQWAEDISGGMIDLLRWFSFVLTLPVILYSSHPFTAAAWRDLKMGSLTMDVPVALALWLAFLASVWITIFGGPEVYYESVCMFAFLLLLSRYIERKVRLKGTQSSSFLMSSMPAAATRITQGEEEVVALNDLRPGDLIRVRPGETIPADGYIREGRTSVNEAALTGEYLPVGKAPGSKIIGGTVNIESPLVAEVTAVGEQTQMSAIMRIMEQAGRERPPIAVMANRVARYFIGATLVVSVLVGWYWWHHSSPQEAFRIVLSILVVTCPCALSLATPTALTAATTALRQRGFLIARSFVLEGIANATTFVFDKTGTLTEGRLAIEEVIPAPGYDREQVLALAAALEYHSVHPIASAFHPYRQGMASEVRTVSGLGLEGMIEERLYRIGVAEFAQSGLSEQARQMAPGNGHWIALASDQELVAWFKLNDRIRPDAESALQALRGLGARLVMLSGDRSSVVAEVGQQLGFDEVRGGCSPEDKLAAMRELQAKGEQIVMVGDGINDVPVMAGAHLSIAMNNASDLTRLNADAILLSDKLMGLVGAVRTARWTKKIIRENLGWSILYNVLALPLAVAGLVTPWQAAIGMSVSSLIVALNALRLTRSKEKASSATHVASPTQA